jgi:hypothetical protein
MFEFEYNNIITRWSSEYGIEFNELQRNMLINLYEKAIEAPKFKKLDFEKFAENIFKQKYYKDKYPGLDVFGGAYSRISQN